MPRYPDEVVAQAVGMTRSGLPAAEVARRLGVSAGSVRTWDKRATAEDWARTVDPHFAFLLAHGFEPLPPRYDGWWSVSRVYRRGRLEVDVMESRESNAVEVQLRDLAGGSGRPRWLDEWACFTSTPLTF